MYTKTQNMGKMVVSALLSELPFFVYTGGWCKLLETQFINGSFCGAAPRHSAKQNRVPVNKFSEFSIAGKEKGANYFLRMFTPFECVFCKCKKKKRNYFLWCFAPFECVLNIWKKNVSFFFPLKIKINKLI